MCRDQPVVMCFFAPCTMANTWCQVFVFPHRTLVRERVPGKKNTGFVVDTVFNSCRVEARQACMTRVATSQTQTSLSREISYVIAGGSGGRCAASRARDAPSLAPGRGMLPGAKGIMMFSVGFECETFVTVSYFVNGNILSGVTIGDQPQSM